MKYVVYTIKGIDRIGLFQTNDYNEAVEFYFRDAENRYLIDTETETVLL